MSRISYFQRYSQQENHATNNTLLVFRYVYQSAPLKLQRVLTSLVDAEISIGLSFEQQVRAELGVPDALINQEPLRIFIETKRGNALDASQIERHITSIARGGDAQGQSILIGLTKEPILPDQLATLRVSAASQGVLFTAVTFSQIVEALRSQCAEFEADLLAMVEDYEQYLAEEGLLEGRNQKLVVFPCGDSFADNQKYGLYYEPTSRPCKRNNQYLGIYTQKQVRLIGKIETIAICPFEDGEIEATEEIGIFTDDHRRRVLSAMEAISYHDLKTKLHRFYLVDRFAETAIHKVSSGGMMNLRYLDLVDLTQGIFNPRQSYATDELAEMLRGTTFH